MKNAQKDTLTLRQLRAILPSTQGKPIPTKEWLKANAKGEAYEFTFDNNYGGYVKEVTAAFYDVFTYSNIPVRNAEAWKVVGIASAVAIGMTVIMGTIIFLVTRGKNSPFRHYTFWETQKAGYWAYGYNAFRVDITPFIKDGDNLLEVDLKNVEESSRWYPGAGIYRPVTIILTPEETRIDDWGLTTTTILNWKEVNGKSLSRFTVEVPIVNPKGKPIVSMRLVGPDGEQITGEAELFSGSVLKIGRISFSVRIENV